MNQTPAGNFWSDSCFKIIFLVNTRVFVWLTHLNASLKGWLGENTCRGMFFTRKFSCYEEVPALSPDYEILR
jgi:hypothetical protein